MFFSLCIFSPCILSSGHIPVLLPTWITQHFFRLSFSFLLSMKELTVSFIVLAVVVHLFTVIISSRFFKVLRSAGEYTFFFTPFQLTSDDKLQILTQLSFHKFVVQNTFVINYFVVGPL